MTLPNYIVFADKDDFRNIFRLYYTPLCHLSNSYLEDKDEAKSVVQDAFLKLWEVSHSSTLGNR